MMWTSPLLFLACVRAVHPVPGSPALDGAFAVVIPEGWELARNRQVLGNAQLTLRAPDGLSAITVELVREDQASRELPLSLVADTFWAETGRSLGVETTPLDLRSLEISGREAWIATAERQHGPNKRLISSAFLRGDEHLAVLTLSVGPTSPAEVVLAWDIVLSSFVLHEPPPEAAPFAREAAGEAELDAVVGPWR